VRECQVVPTNIIRYERQRNLADKACVPVERERRKMYL